jgi:hypothetical protein
MKLYDKDDIFGGAEEAPRDPQKQPQRPGAPVEQEKPASPVKHLTQKEGTNITDIKGVLEALRGNPELLAQFKTLMGTGVIPSNNDNYNDIDLEDTLDVPVTFFTYCIAYVTLDDKRFGREVKNPAGRRINFKHVQTLRIAGGRPRDDKWIQISTYTTWSKKEAMWLERHSKFNVKFHKTVQKEHAENTELMLAQMEASSYVSALGQHELLADYKNNINPVPNTDFDFMKSKVYEWHVNRILEIHKRTRQAVVQQTFNTLESLNPAGSPQRK